MLEGLGETQSAKIQAAYFGALGDDVAEFTADASALETWASTTGKVSSGPGGHGMQGRSYRSAGRNQMVVQIQGAV